MVELRKLLACQWWVDTDVSGGVHGATVHAQPTDDEVAEKCLPMPIIPAADVLAQSCPNGMIVYSTNNTLRVFGPNFDHTNGQFTYAIGTNANLMLVYEFGGRYVLVNGYHRAWLLRSRNVTMVPAIVRHVSSMQEVLPSPQGWVPAHVLFGPRPPTIDDFFSDQTSATVDMRAVLKAIKVTAEILTIPRVLY